MGRVTRRVPTRRLTVAGDAVTVVRRPDTLAGEEPLEIRVAGQPVVVTMRTPGDDLDLAVGFLLAEGLVPSPDAVAGAVYCSDADASGSPTLNVLDLTLAPGTPPVDLTGRRTFGITSACGVCGSASIDAVRARAGTDLSADRTVVPATRLVDLPARMLAAQRTFARTGGLHAAGLFDADGDLVAVREDVGRHNAVDKLLGWAARQGLLPLTGHVLVLSGRVSFELAQKAWMASVPVVAAVSAPSTLAVELAERAGMTLVGFLRPPGMNVYTAPERIDVTAATAPTPGPDVTAAAPR